MKTICNAVLTAGAILSLFLPASAQAAGIDGIYPSESPHVLGYDYSWALRDGRADGVELVVDTDVSCKVSLDASGKLPAGVSGAEFAPAGGGISRRAAVGIAASGGQKIVELRLLLEATGKAPAKETVRIVKATVIPAPREVKWTDGVFDLGGARIVLPEECPDKLKEDAVYLAEELRRKTGVEIKVAEKTSASGCILLGHGKPDKDLGEEGYVFSSSGGNLVIDAIAPRGIFWGIQTCLQLAERKSGGGGFVWGAEIRDRPDYAVRGVMLDIGRAFMKVETVERHIRMLARYKMNTLHLHLNDHPICGFATAKYPKIGTVGKNGERCHYNAEDLKRIAACARRHHVDVIPEVESAGGHAATLLRGLKEGHGIDLGPVYRGNIAQDRFYQVMDDIFGELIEIFKPRYVHMGLDECKGWSADPEAKKLMEERGWTHEEQLVFQHYAQRMDQIIRKRGCRSIVWSIGGTPGYVVGKTVSQLAEATGLKSWDIVPAHVICMSSPGMERGNGYDTIGGAYHWPCGTPYYQPRRGYPSPWHMVRVGGGVPKPGDPGEGKGGRLLGAVCQIWETPVYALDIIWETVIAQAETLWAWKKADPNVFVAALPATFFGRRLHPESVAAAQLNPSDLKAGALAMRRLETALADEQVENKEFLSSFRAMLWRKLALLALDAGLSEETRAAVLKEARPHWEGMLREHLAGRCSDNRRQQPDTREALLVKTLFPEWREDALLKRLFPEPRVK